MARVETIVVGGGINPGSPFTLNGIPYVSQASPPFISTTDFLSVVPTGTNRGVIISTTGDPLVGTDRLRVKGGMVSEHASYTGTTVVGQLHTVSGAYANGFVLYGPTITLTSVAGANNSPPVLIGSGVSVVSSATAGGTSCVGVGSNLAVTGATIQNCVWVGNDITDGSGSSTVLIGSLAVNGTGQFSVVIGSGAQANGSGSSCIVIGRSATKASGVASTTLIGDSATAGAGASNGVCIGSGAGIGAGGSCTVVGETSTATHAHCIILGSGVASFQANTAIIGQNRFSNVLSTLVLGSGDTSANMGNFTVRLSDQSGANKAAPQLTIRAGLGTGTGAVSQISLSTSVAVGAGSGLQTVQERMRLDGTTTAGQTAMMLWDVDNATLERVTVGAADSGGVGFKLLRIPN